MRTGTFVVCCIIVGVFVLGFIGSLVFTPAYNLETGLRENKEAFTQLTEFFQGFGDQRVVIYARPDNYILHEEALGEHRYIQIENENIKNAIDVLFKELGYYGIEKEERGITFVIDTQSGIEGIDHSGLIYMFDEKEPSAEDFDFIVLKKLRVKGWYYYSNIPS